MLQSFARWIVSAIGISGSLGDTLQFWIYDSIKISGILLLVITAVGYLRTYLPPEKIRDYLEGKGSVVGYLMAAGLGIVSPFCSCSTIPIFLGFVGAGVPFGMTITFLFVSPMVNEAAIIVLVTTLGWRVALAYLLGGITVGVAGGYILNALGFERFLIEFEFGSSDISDDHSPSPQERFKLAWSNAREIVARVLPYVLLGVGVGALIHGFLPQEIIARYLQGSFAVPGAVMLGVPIYTNIMGVIPVVESLVGKGLPVGTSVAFMMSVAALSLPEFVMLKKVMKKRLIGAYGVVLATGILIMGIVLNFVFVS